MKATYPLLATVGLLLSSMAMAQDDTNSFRCGESIVEVGMSAVQVLQLCGEPTARMGDDQWIYERGPDQFTITVTFQADNTVGRIDAAPAAGD